MKEIFLSAMIVIMYPKLLFVLYYFQILFENTL